MKFMPVLLLVLLASCTSAVTPIPTIVKPIPVAVPQIAPLALNSVHWQILSINGNVVFGLNEENFKNQELNQSEITRFITDQKSVVTLLKSIISAQQK